MKILKGLLFVYCFISAAQAQEAQTHYVKITKPEPVNSNVQYNMGTAVNPAGSSITVTPQSLLLNGKPVVPVMGEMHFSRVPEGEWETALLKMKAGGITVVSTYVFWIHHEELEGKYRWDGQRNLRKFIETCAKLQLPLVLRIGPWAHGECRNGGFPEWLVKSGIKLRADNPGYLAKVRGWYQQIFNQAKGLLWKDGGTVIGIQLENEYGGKWEHLATLKSMARDCGFDVPLYTRTGWPKLGSAASFGEILPLYGDYADGFWDRSLNEMPGDYRKTFLFRSFRNSTVIATEQLPKQSDKDNPQDYSYPYLTCELGGGMMPSYHRRINIAPMDVYAMAMVKLGSGSNLPGYYMYHGGTNPAGEQTTLNEEQATSFTNHNDLPVKTYDFQAPLGEFGQVNPQYHLLRRMHLFLQDFGEQLALMQPLFPDSVQNPADVNALRWNVRSNGESGYLFVNNYERLAQLPAKKNVSFSIDLPAEKIRFPKTPVTIPAGCSFFVPFNMQLGTAVLKYATAQPICKIREGNTLTVFFAQIAGLSASFLFDAKGVKMDKGNAAAQTQEGIYFNNVQPGMNAAIRFTDANGLAVQIVLLDEQTSLHCWKGILAGKEHVFISAADITCNGNVLELGSTKNAMHVSVYPALRSLSDRKKMLSAQTTGIFSTYTASTAAMVPIKVSLSKINDAGTLREIRTGRAKVAESPKDSAFAAAAVWKISLPKNTNAARNIFLKIPYTGDVARVYAGEQFLTDNFYNGKVFEIGLKRFGSEVYEKGLTLKILPLQKDAPVYLQPGAKPVFGTANSMVALPAVETYEQYSIRLSAE